MAESGENWTPDPSWTGFSYDKARAKHVDPSAGRGYAISSTFNKLPDKDASVKAPKAIVNRLIPDKMITESKSPVVIVTDGTGSMGTFPNTIFEKLPLLDDGVKDYLEDAEVSFAMIGDAACDKYPLQIQEFAKGKELVNKLNNLAIEGGGGGNQMESYELAALYYARNVEIPKATKPVMIFICDEGVYPNVDKQWAKEFAKVDLKEKLTTAQLFQELSKKYSLYCIRKHYEHAGTFLNGEELVGLNKSMHEKWQALIGADRVAILLDPRRVVDVILGLLAHETGKMDFFTKEITDRQKEDQVKTVMKSMQSITKKDPAKTVIDPNLSVTKKANSGKKTDSLL